jgi:hypothetical protein
MNWPRVLSFRERGTGAGLGDSCFYPVSRLIAVGDWWRYPPRLFAFACCWKAVWAAIAGVQNGDQN